MGISSIKEKQSATNEETVEVLNCRASVNSSKASDIIRRKLIENNGEATFCMLQKKPCKIWLDADNERFCCDKLKVNPPYQYKIFDIVVNFLISQGGRAEKGSGRSYRLGEPKCNRTTVAGIIGYQYFKAKDGDSILDPVPMLAAILEWADIAYNERGWIVLTENYKKIRSSLNNAEK